MIFLFYICLVVAIYYSFVNIGCLIRGLEITWFKILLMSLSLGGIITYLMGLW